MHDARPALLVNELAEDVAGPQQPQWPEVHDLRPRCFRALRLLLALNSALYWAVVWYCSYAYHLRVMESGTKALPPLDASLFGIFVLGTQATLEFAAAACLTRPARANDARSAGFRAWDGAAWLTGAGARTAMLLDAMCLPLMRRASSLLFLLSVSTFVFAIGIFVFIVQLRLLVGLFLGGDNFSYDKPDLFFKGRDAHGMLDGMPMAAQPPLHREDDDPAEALHSDRAPPLAAIKAANCAHFSDLLMLHAVLTRLYIPLSCQETQEFILSAASFSRCFCEDVVQCSVKFFFLMDCDVNFLVLISMLLSAAQAVSSCFYASTSSMDLRATDETVRD